MNDLERELRSALDREAGSAPAPHDARAAMGRTRRRQVGTVSATAVGIAAVIAIAIVGFRAIGDESGEVVPASTTQTMNGITITFPEAWAVIDPDEAGLNGPSPTRELPRLVLALAPFDPDELFACPGMAATPHAFLMTIQEEPLALSGDAARAWPVELEQLDVGTSESRCYPGWEFLQGGWTAAGRTFEARIGMAPDLSDADRDALLAAFRSMTFDPAENGPVSVVLESGEIGGEGWELIATRDDSGLSLSLETEDSGGGLGGFSANSSDLQFAEQIVGNGDGARNVVFGAVPPGTAAIECPDPAAIRTFDVPDEIDDRFEAFVVELDVGLEVELQAVDVDGNVIASGRAGRHGGDRVETRDVLPHDVSPEHGGTYWAAYVWLGPAGADGAELTARQVRDLGATPSVGELACDEGAAEALGSDAEWRVALYFETRQEAAEWYLDSGYAGHDAETGIARVTTYCLD